MNRGIANTPKKLESCFIVKAATNSAMALQMAQQVWTDPELAGYEIADFVDIINSVSIKLRNYCQMVNRAAHIDKQEE